MFTVNPKPQSFISYLSCADQHNVILLNRMIKLFDNEPRYPWPGLVNIALGRRGAGTRPGLSHGLIVFRREGLIFVI